MLLAFLQTQEMHIFVEGLLKDSFPMSMPTANVMGTAHQMLVKAGSAPNRLRPRSRVLSLTYSQERFAAKRPGNIVRRDVLRKPCANTQVPSQVAGTGAEPSGATPRSLRS